MKLSMLLFTFALFWKSSTSIRCYQCAAEMTYTVSAPACDYFDGSDRYIADCPDSSMCYKRVTALDLSNGITSKSYHRGCAAQTISGDQKKINGTWQIVHNIYDVYDEDCKADETDVHRITNTMHCYCRGELCNGSLIHYAHLTTSLFISIMLTLATM